MVMKSSDGAARCGGAPGDHIDVWGGKSGALTPRETRKLERGQRHLEKLETKAQADGKVTAREKVRLEHAQDVQSKRIYNQKHDKQTR